MKGNLRKVDSVARRGGWKGEPFNPISITGKLSITDTDRRTVKRKEPSTTGPQQGKPDSATSTRS